MYCFVNIKIEAEESTEKNSYRWYKTTDDYDLTYFKGIPRGPLGTEAVGWHYHNCYSSPEDLYWAALNRLEWWDGPENVPDLDFWKYIFSKRGEVYKEEDSKVMTPIKMFLLQDDPEFQKNRVIPIKSLSPYIFNNIEKFPHVKET